MLNPPDRAFEGLSREVHLVADREGKVQWLDDRARRALEIEVGSSLREIVARGAEEKLAGLLAATDDSANTTWELVVCVGKTQIVLAVRMHVLPGDLLALSGSLVPDDYGTALAQLGSALSEMAGLHRETDRQQRELLRRHEELLRLNRERRENDKAVVALHAEIDQKDGSLRAASDVKVRLIANVTHELRTPLNSILGLTKLLLSRADGELTAEQETQLSFIKQSTEALYALVDDLLDVSKLEAGEASLHVTKLPGVELMAALRGMMRPLVTTDAVELVVEEPRDQVVLETDDGKVAQILRNLVSNALKFTDEGEVRVSLAACGDGEASFEVSDTGVGIPPGDIDRVFEEFFQVDHPRQRHLRGTGLGLAVSRHLAERLGGSLTVRSELGKGSTFTLRIPTKHPEVTEMDALSERSREVAPGAQPILVVEDDRQTLFLYEKYLRGSGFHVLPARSVDEARAMMEKIRPCAIVLDVMLDGEATWSFLRDLKSNPRTQDIPALVVTVTKGEEKARALGADEFLVKPMDRDWLLKKLRSLARVRDVRTVLVVDDDDVARYLVRKQLEGSEFLIIEASGGEEGIHLARTAHPDVMFLDFVMPGMSAFDVIDELKRDPATRSIPIIIHTSKSLADEERKRLEQEASAILSKQSLSREIAISRIREVLQQAGIGKNGGDKRDRTNE